MGAKFNNNPKKEREIIPEDQYDCRCYSVIDLGTHHSDGQYGPKDDRKILITFEIPELMITYEKNGVEVTAPKVIGQQFNNVMGERANLRKFLQAWRGKSFTDEEAFNFDISKILSHGAQISVEHNTTDKGTFANIAVIGPLHKSVALPPQHNETMNFGIEDDLNTPLWDKIPLWIQNKIRVSAEYIAMTNSDTAEHTAAHSTPDRDAIEDDFPF